MRAASGRKAMKSKIEIIILMTGLLVMLATVSLADSIRLMDGRVMEGEIINVSATHLILKNGSCIPWASVEWVTVFSQNLRKEIEKLYPEKLELPSSSPSPDSNDQDVKKGTIIILERKHAIGFIEVDGKQYINWSELHGLLPYIFSLTTDGEILVNPRVFPYVLDDQKDVGSPGVIRSRIDGVFKGWKGDTIFPLINGQVWQQAEYGYLYHYAHRPEVTIYKSGTGYKMKVEGVDREIRVKRIE